MQVDTSANSSFSRELPGLQLAVDSTSLGEYKLCPRKYYLGIIQGWQPRQTSVHLEFGLWLHGARERYDHWRAKDIQHDEALTMVLRWVLTQTWDARLQRPWFSDHKYKNRYTLVRTVVWYLDQFGQNDPLTTVRLANGKPAVELSFSFSIESYAESTGEAYTLCGHLDRLASLGTETYVVDIKTTSGSLGPSWISQFTPGNQFSLYSLAGRVVYEQPVAGIIVDGVQVAVGFSRFERALIPRSESQLDEWLADTKFWLRQMEQSAIAEHWPQNDKACSLYGGCPFQPICSKPPASREQWLQTSFTRRIWDPLQRRGDI